MPLGPREVLRMRAMAFPAEMLAFWASSPLSLVFCSCSLMIMNGLPNSSKASAIFGFTSRFYQISHPKMQSKRVKESVEALRRIKGFLKKP